MNLLREFFQAMLVAGLPLAALAFAMVWWALHRGQVAGETFDDLRRSLEGLAAERKERKNGKKGAANADEDEGAGEAPPPRRPDPAIDKWLSFGGNFYGLVALYTWLRIEFDDVADFFSGLGSIVLRFDIGGFIGLLINLFIESIMNFVAAITWPVYWLGRAQPFWLWLGVAYAGYRLGVLAAQRVTGREWRGGWSELMRFVNGRGGDGADGDAGDGKTPAGERDDDARP